MRNLAMMTMLTAIWLSASAAEACFDCRGRAEHLYVYGYGITDPGYFSGVVNRIRLPHPWHSHRYQDDRRRHRHSLND